MSERGGDLYLLRHQISFMDSYVTTFVVTACTARRRSRVAPPPRGLEVRRYGSLADKGVLYGRPGRPLFKSKMSDHTPPSRKAHRQEKPFIGISPNLAIPISTTPRFMQPTAASRALVGKDPITSGAKPACSPRPAAQFGADAKVTVRAKTPPSRKFAKSQDISLSPACAPEPDGIAPVAAREALSPYSQCIEDERRRAFSTAVPSLDALLSSLEETSPSPVSSPAPDDFNMSPDAAAEAFLPSSPSRRMPLQSRGSASLGSRRPSDAKGTENVYFSLTPPGKGMTKASADVLEEALSAGLKRLESPRVSDAMPTAAPVVPNIFSPESDKSVAEEEDTESHGISPVGSLWESQIRSQSVAEEEGTELELEVNAAAEAPESDVAEAAAESETLETALVTEAFELGLEAEEPEAAEGTWVPSSLQLDGDGLDDDELDDDEIFASSSELQLAPMSTTAAPALVEAAPMMAPVLLEAVPAASIPPGASPVAPETLVARAAAKRAMAALAAARAMSATMSAACAEMQNEDDKQGADAEEEEDDEEQLSDNMVEAASVEPPRPLGSRQFSLESRQFSLEDYEAQKQKRRRETAPPMLRPSAPRMSRPPSRQQEQPPPEQEQEPPSPAPTSCTKSAAAMDEGGLASPETPQWLRTAEVTLRNTPLPVRPPALTSIKEAAASTASPTVAPSKPLAVSAGRSVAALALTLALVAILGGLVSLHYMSRPTEMRPTDPLLTEITEISPKSLTEISADPLLITMLPLSVADLENVAPVPTMALKNVAPVPTMAHMPTQAVFAPASVDFTSHARAPKSRPKSRAPKPLAPPVWTQIWTGSTALVALPSPPEITLPIRVRLHAPPVFFYAQHGVHHLELASSMAACSVVESAAHGPYSLTGLRLPFPLLAPTPKKSPKVDAALDDAWHPSPAHLALLPFGWHTGAAAELLMPSPPEPEAREKGAPIDRALHALAVAVGSLALLALSILYNPLRPAGRAALAAALAAERTVPVQTTAADVNPEVATFREALLSPPVVTPVVTGSTRKPKSKSARHGARPPTPPPFLSPGTGGTLAYGSESAYRIEVVQGTEGGVRVTPVRRSKRTGHVEGEASSAVLRGK